MEFGQIQSIFQEEGNLVQKEGTASLVFVGDTHGDYQASQEVFTRYFNSENTIVFLGDYVDRGKRSRENINFLLQKKRAHPERVYLLQGNHEGYKYQPFSPVDFWDSLSREETKQYGDLLGSFPLVFSHRNIIACHGGLPNVEHLSDIEDVDPGDENWKKITWGDFTQNRGYTGSGFGRPQLGKDYFDLIMDKLEKTLLIRSHQPHAPLITYQDRCITIFTSSAYGTERRVALVPSGAESAEDVTIEKLD